MPIPLVNEFPSALCDEYSIQPSLFYLWQRQPLENSSAALALVATTAGTYIPARRAAAQDPAGVLRGD